MRQRRFGIRRRPQDLRTHQELTPGEEGRIAAHFDRLVQAERARRHAAEGWTGPILAFGFVILGSALFMGLLFGLAKFSEHWGP